MILITRTLISRWFLPIAVLTRAFIVIGAPLPDSYRELRLGTVDFQVSSSNKDAQEWFNYGILHLFAFGYDYATPAFQEAQAHDPEFALAYAFEAFAEFHPLWSKDDTSAANAIFFKMDNATTIANAHEQLYIDAFRAHFETSVADVVDRNRKSNDIFQKMTEEYPNDPTAFAYLGLFSLLVHTGVIDENESAAYFDMAAQALKSSLVLQDDHPAAIHFQLHLYDNILPEIWKQGISAARKYPQVAPDASHGLHMPQHILHRDADFAGSWDADIQALQAADKTCALYGMGDDPLCDLWNLYHSVEYLQIEGYHCGLWEDAHSIFERMEANYTTAVEMDLPNSSYLLNFYLRMRAREFLEQVMLSGFLFGEETLDVDCPPSIDPLAEGRDNAHTESGYLLARGLCLLGISYPSEDRVLFAAVLARMDEITSYYEAFDERDPLKYFDKLVHYGQRDMLHAALHFVQNSGGGSVFKAWMTNATNYEETHTGEFWSSAVWTMLHLSPHEFYGQLLLAQAKGNRLNEDEQLLARNFAMQEFLDSDRTQGPQLSTSLGKARAASGIGNSTEASKHYTFVAEMMHPDANLEALPFWNEIQSVITKDPVGKKKNKGKKTKTEKTAPSVVIKRKQAKKGVSNSYSD